MFFTKNVSTIEKLSFHLAHVRILGSMECGKTINDCFRANASKNNIEFKKDYAEKFTEVTGIEIYSKNWGGKRKLPMEGIAVEYFPTSIDTSNNVVKSEFHSYISDENEQYTRDSHAHMVHL